MQQVLADFVTTCSKQSQGHRKDFGQLQSQPWHKYSYVCLPIAISIIVIVMPVHQCTPFTTRIHTHTFVWSRCLFWRWNSPNRFSPIHNIVDIKRRAGGFLYFCELLYDNRMYELQSNEHWYLPCRNSQLNIEKCVVHRFGFQGFSISCSSFVDSPDPQQTFCGTIIDNNLCWHPFVTNYYGLIIWHSVNKHILTYPYFLFSMLRWFLTIFIHLPQPEPNFITQIPYLCRTMLSSKCQKLIESFSKIHIFCPLNLDPTIK